MKVYVRAPYPENRLAELRELFDEVLYEPWTETGERYYEDEMLEHLLEVQPDVLITELDRVTEKVLGGYKGLKAIGDCRATPANLDVAACTKAGVPVLCTPGRNNQAVAELVVALIILHMRHGLEAIQWVKDGKWVAGTTPYFLWMGHELQYKRVGLVGFGAVAQAAAKILDAFDCEVCYYDYKGRQYGSYKSSLPRGALRHLRRRLAAPAGQRLHPRHRHREAAALHEARRALCQRRALGPGRHRGARRRAEGQGHRGRGARRARHRAAHPRGPRHRRTAPTPSSPRTCAAPPTRSPTTRPTSSTPA